MKSKSVHYVIPTPCHENWEQMSPEHQGRFCESCAKKVVDFSTMPDFSMVQYLETNKQEQVCGRFTRDQLEKRYDLPQRQLFSLDLRAVILGVALTTMLPDSGFAQVNKEQPAIHQQDTAYREEPMIMGDVAMMYDHTNEKELKGKVTLADPLQMKDVVILLVDGQGKELARVLPAEDGTYRMDLDWKLNPVTLRFTAAYAQEVMLNLAYEPSLDQVNVTLYFKQELIKGKVIRKE